MNLLYAWVDLHKSNPKTNEWTFKTYKRPPFFNLNALNSLNFGLNTFSLSFYNQIKNHSFASAQPSSFSLISMHYIMILPIAMPSPSSQLQHRCIHNNQIQSCFEYKHQSIHSVACLSDIGLNNSNSSINNFLSLLSADHLNNNNSVDHLNNILTF